MSLAINIRAFPKWKKQLNEWLYLVLELNDLPKSHIYTLISVLLQFVTQLICIGIPLCDNVLLCYYQE